MGELYVKAQELDTAERATAFWIIAGILADAAKLGRTEEWKSACAFAVLQVEAGHDVEWAVLQGSIYMAHANS
jgi:ribosome biogenesis SPOUT family RNA methylase Rps3